MVQRPTRRTSLYSPPAASHITPWRSRHTHYPNRASPQSGAAFSVCRRRAGRRREAYRVHEHQYAETSCRRPLRHRELTISCANLGLEVQLRYRVVRLLRGVASGHLRASTASESQRGTAWARWMRRMSCSMSELRAGGLRRRWAAHQVHCLPNELVHLWSHRSEPSGGCCRQTGSDQRSRANQR